ncbi:hypothetical protein CK203_110412 [Vitis vinifera]|uniref:Uncharacterized protein n=1 Tax=Vitis vinifera TaxID=29760 RepID=A0A438CD24_VITVI|nr:hypothetical protein CK203_110412 [Vitis vinifera]
MASSSSLLFSVFILFSILFLASCSKDNIPATITIPLTSTFTSKPLASASLSRAHHLKHAADPKKVPIFDPKLSSSSKILDCRSPKCVSTYFPYVHLGCPRCNGNSKHCSYACPYSTQRQVDFGLPRLAKPKDLATLPFSRALLPRRFITTWVSKYQDRQQAPEDSKQVSGSRI